MSDQGMKNLEKHRIVRITRRIKEICERFVILDRTAIDDVAMAETMDHLSLDRAQRLKFRPVKGGVSWGQPWGTAWFRLRIAVPAGFRGRKVVLHFETGGECIIFRDGAPVQALDAGRNEYVLFDRAKGGERVTLHIEAGANSDFGRFQVRVMQQPWMGVFLAEMWDAWNDLVCLADLVGVLPENDTRRARIVHALHKAVDRVDYGEPEREDLSGQARSVRAALKAVYDCRASASAQTIACLGHAHIDVAWLWPLAETIRKCGRTFSNVLELMDRYPEFIFVQSQPHLYEFARDRYPALYARIKDKVRRGQWVPTGCTWVEMDCNVTGGESLVRQILFGTRFFRKEFNCDSVCLWLPDVFGYSAAIPQLLKRSGIGYFLTQKLSWSQYTRFPYHSFWWEGMDGSRVLTHFPPADTYNGQLSAAEILNASWRYREKDRSSIQAFPYGFGDGGGGPTREMLERMRRYRDLEGAPKLAPMSPKEFFGRLEAESADLPRWTGELYLEFHRGTYTTQAHNKAFNRRSEILLHDGELLSALTLLSGGRYESAEFHALWKLVLLNQFHDIIPGSSITQVYEDSARHYAEILDRGTAVRARAIARLGGLIDTRGEGVPVVAFNTLSWRRRDTVAAKIAGLRKNVSYVAVGPDGAESPVQAGHDGTARFVGEIPSVGHAVFHVRKGKSPAAAIRAGRDGMENESLRVGFDRQGRLREVYDKRTGRHALAPGAAGNRFLLFEDKPTGSDAWDIDIFYGERLLEADGKLLSAEVIEQGPARSVVRFRRAISRSTIEQDVILTAGSGRLDFVTTVQWGNEKDVLLKVAFPVNVRSEKARYEIQFGNVERPTHWNRPSDFAMFEVPAQRWADLSESDYGVALLNDCKYGYDIRDNVIRLSLLRAPKTPDPVADVNKEHRFTYSLLPHEGGYANGVVRAGYELNVPVMASVAKASAGRIGKNVEWLGVSGNNVIIDTIKKAEDDDGLIVRLYEAHGCRGRRVLRIGFPVKRVEETNLMEKEERRLAVRRGAVALEFTPFQIRTLKLGWR